MPNVFAGRISPLGNKHVDICANALCGQIDCGESCEHRTRTISCPFLAHSVPCLVGCQLKIVERGGTDAGLQYDEHDFIVLAQAGSYLIGEEQIISLDNPRIMRWRIVVDKHGNSVVAGSPAGVSLAAAELANDISELENELSERENKHG